jgi:hypothetical protein
MSNMHSAQLLLACSYYHSARRISMALAGRLPISNSRERADAPSFLGEVVGLCGQGGRHSYFRIPIATLEMALDRIEALEPDMAELTASAHQATPDLEQHAIDEIGAACRDLRQQTLFDSGTGCVNDRLPAMVPLLPPEEIWFEGRELPLDIWRLVSFEFDLVTSGVASQAAVEDFAFSAVNPAGLAFRALMNQVAQQQTQFEVRPNTLPAPWDALLPAPRILTVSVARLFFEAGSLLTPLADQDFIKGYGAIRYHHWLDRAKADLRVRDEFNRDSIDNRYRGLFAEEMAIGKMAVVLGDIFNARPINNTAEVLPTGSISPNQPIADFIAQARHPIASHAITIIAESKGSLGTTVSKSRLKRAKEQIAATNLHFAGAAQTLPLTFASSISFSGQSRSSSCIVSDPPIDNKRPPLKADPTAAWRVAYAKAFRFVGIESATRPILRGEPAETVRPVDFDRTAERKRSERDQQRVRRASAARERFGMELVLDAGECAIGVAPEVLGVLREGIREGMEQKLEAGLQYREKRRRHADGRTFETGLGLGCVYYSDLE